ncbi:hypothetical protein [Candidatus Ruminimicrobium bovinum]|uniref:hypothetical protein n=1 Tax=Candidatus Ruminimicrobium bovinum TaxID=3242779 RepID=UPI0039B82B90
MFKKFSIGYLIVILFCSFIFAGISVSPTKQELVLKGLDKNKTSAEFVVENKGLLDETVYITTRDWENSPNNMEVNVSSWLTVDVSSFVIKPYESKTVKCSVDLPGAAGSGYVSAMVSFTTVKDSVNNVISLPVYVIKYITENKEYTPFSVSNFKNAFVNDKFVMTCDVVNKSNFYFRPKLKYTLKKGKDVVFEYEVLNTAPVYAMNRRSFSSGFFEGTLKNGKYIMTVEVDVDGTIKTKTVEFRIDKKK